MIETLLECSRCGNEKPTFEFYKRTKSLTVFSPWCKDCHRIYDKERYRNLDKLRKNTNQRAIRQRNLEWIVSYLKTHPCILCGEDDIVVLDFDHRDETSKSHNIGDMLSNYSIENILKEIEKCDVLCANCHRKRTSLQFGWKKAILGEQNNGM